MKVSNSHWSGFHYNVMKLQKQFCGVELQFIYYGVIVTNMNNGIKKEFCGSDLERLYGDVYNYIHRTFRRHTVTITIKEKHYDYINQ